MAIKYLRGKDSVHLSRDILVEIKQVEKDSSQAL